MLTYDQLITVVIALVSSAGMWSYLSARAKLAHENAVNTNKNASEYSGTLKEQVDRLASKLDDKTEQIEQLLKEIAELRSELSAAKVTITHLETILRTK